MKTEQTMIDKQTQDQAWSVLPANTRKDMRIDYSEPSMSDRQKGWDEALEYYFGDHNLTSDAEPEEMLTVETSLVKELYKRAKEIEEESKRIHYPMIASKYCGVQRAIEYLFDSKRLPDDLSENLSEPSSDDSKAEPLSQNSAENCDNENHNSNSEPKFKIGQRVRHKTTRLVDVISGVSQCAPYIYHFKHMVNPIDGQGIFESDLEPYTAPTQTNNNMGNKEHRNLSQDAANCDKQFDNILNDSFRNERRLNIATAIMAGAMANPNIIKSRDNLRAISDEWLASRTLELTDALISECGKGGSDD